MSYFQKYKNYLDYFPIVLITILFIAETEIEKHALHTSCQIAITIVTLIVFYILVIRYENTRLFSVIVAGIIWAILIYIKKKYITL